MIKMQLINDNLLCKTQDKYVIHNLIFCNKKFRNNDKKIVCSVFYVI